MAVGAIVTLIVPRALKIRVINLVGVVIGDDAGAVVLVKPCLDNIEAPERIRSGAANQQRLGNTVSCGVVEDLGLEDGIVVVYDDVEQRQLPRDGAVTARIL